MTKYQTAFWKLFVSKLGMKSRGDSDWKSQKMKYSFLCRPVWNHAPHFLVSDIQPSAWILPTSAALENQWSLENQYTPGDASIVSLIFA